MWSLRSNCLVAAILENEPVDPEEGSYAIVMDATLDEVPAGFGPDDAHGA